MIGTFAISEIIRYAVDTNPELVIVDQPIGNVFMGLRRLAGIAERCEPFVPPCGAPQAACCGAAR